MCRINSAALIDCSKIGEDRLTMGLDSHISGDKNSFVFLFVCYDKS